MKKSEALYLSAREASAADEAARTRRTTVLIVDDEPLVREVAILTLESEGFSVLAARDGREARDLVGSRDDIGAVIVIGRRTSGG